MPMTNNVSAGAFGMATMPSGAAIAGNGNATLQATAPGGPAAAQNVSAPAISWVGIALLLVAIRILHERYGARVD